MYVKRDLVLIKRGLLILAYLRTLIVFLLNLCYQKKKLPPILAYLRHSKYESV